MKQVLSCIQPTGRIHFGNYFGAIQNWVNLQKDYKCIFGVVDYHAMTMAYEVKKLRQNTWEMIFDLIAVGVKPENLFIQSLIPEHAELGWIFNCFCSYGNLTRMTQFKDKTAKNTDGDLFISAGLLDYPVLQVADILIYKADFVPVGKDQDQHLELSRTIAHRFNKQVGKEYFVLPETLHTNTPKVMSTANPERKMSKSAGEKHVISVFAEELRIRKQIKSAITDTGNTSDGEMSSGIANLFEIIKACGNHDAYNQLKEDYKNRALKYVNLKDVAAEGLVALGNQFREKRADVKANKKAVKFAIKESSAIIRKQAQQTVSEVKDLCGLLNVKF